MFYFEPLTAQRLKFSGVPEVMVLKTANRYTDVRHMLAFGMLLGIVVADLIPQPVVGLVAAVRHPPAMSASQALSNSLALMAKISLKARAKEADPEKPVSRAIAVMLLRGLLASCMAAFSMRTRWIKRLRVSLRMALKIR